MDSLVRARVLLAEADALGVSVEDLVAASAGSPRTKGVDVPTVAEWVERIAPTFTEGTLGTYKSYWTLLVARYGDRPIDEVGYDGCELVVADAQARAQQSRPGSKGLSARENCVGALRAFYERAKRAKLVTDNPASELDKPRRLPNRRRSLTDGEMDEVIGAVRTTSRDPDLDLLLVDFHLESGARREGALNLDVNGVDQRRSTVWLDEKFSQEREQPISPSLVERLLTQARARGAAAGSDKVFRTRQGRPITRRRYNTLFDKVQAALPWSVRTPITAHVLRWTGGTAVERIAGEAVAEAFLGHKPATYTRAMIGEVAAAVAVLTGEAHPLADSREVRRLSAAPTPTVVEPPSADVLGQLAALLAGRPS
jgi:integrase/recombinase XerC